MTTPNLKLRAPVPFPAKVQGAGGISVSKAAGVWTVQPDFSQLAALVASGVGDPTSKQMWIYDPVTGQYNVLTLAGLGDAMFKATSTTSLAIGTGSKVFTTQSGKDIGVGSFVMVTSDANPSINYMFGQVTAYSGTTLTVNVTVTGGSGTYADWTIRVAGARGVPSSATVVSSAATFTATSVHQGGILLVDTGAAPAQGTITISLPLVSSCVPGLPIRVKKAYATNHSGKVVVQATDLIDGMASVSFEIPGEEFDFYPGNATWNLGESLWSVRGSFVKGHHSVTSQSFSVATPFTVDGSTCNGQMFDANTSLAPASDIKFNLPAPATLTQGYNPAVMLHKKDDGANKALYYTPGATWDQASSQTVPFLLQDFGDAFAIYTDGGEYRTLWRYDAHRNHVNNLSLSSTTSARQGNACAASATIYLVPGQNGGNGGDHIDLPSAPAATAQVWHNLRVRSTISHLLSAATYGSAVSINSVHHVYVALVADGSIQLFCGAANAGSAEYTLLDGVRVNAAAMTGGIVAKQGRWIGSITTDGAGNVVYIDDGFISPSLLYGKVGINAAPPTMGNATLQISPTLGENFITLQLSGGTAHSGYFQADATGVQLRNISNGPLELWSNNLKRVSVAADGGMFSNGATGGSKGLDTINFVSVYQNGAAVATYASGPWTPTLIGSTTPGTGQTYTAQVGSYEQIGRVVIARFNIVATSLGTAAGNLQIGGLPVPSANVAGDNGVCWISNYTVTGLAASNYGVTGDILANTSVIRLLSNGNTGSNFVTVAQAGGTPAFLGACIYRAS